MDGTNIPNIRTERTETNETHQQKNVMKSTNRSDHLCRYQADIPAVLAYINWAEEESVALLYVSGPTLRFLWIANSKLCQTMHLIWLRCMSTLSCFQDVCHFGSSTGTFCFQDVYLYARQVGSWTYVYLFARQTVLPLSHFAHRLRHMVIVQPFRAYKYDDGKRGLSMSVLQLYHTGSVAFFDSINFVHDTNVSLCVHVFKLPNVLIYDGSCLYQRHPVWAPSL